MHILIILIWKCLFLLQIVPCDNEHHIRSTGQHDSTPSHTLRPIILLSCSIVKFLFETFLWAFRAIFFICTSTHWLYVDAVCCYYTAANLHLYQGCHAAVQDHPVRMFRLNTLLWPQYILSSRTLWRVFLMMFMLFRDTTLCWLLCVTDTMEVLAASIFTSNPRIVSYFRELVAFYMGTVGLAMVWARQ